MLQFVCASVNCLQLFLGTGSITVQSGSINTGQHLIYQSAARQTTYSCTYNSKILSCDNLSARQGLVKTPDTWEWTTRPNR